MALWFSVDNRLLEHYVFNKYLLYLPTYYLSVQQKKYFPYPSLNVFGRRSAFKFITSTETVYFRLRCEWGVGRGWRRTWDENILSRIFSRSPGAWRRKYVYRVEYQPESYDIQSREANLNVIIYSCIFAEFFFIGTVTDRAITQRNKFGFNDNILNLYIYFLFRHFNLT